MQLVVEAVRYAQLTDTFVRDLHPYAHQMRTLECIRDAIAQKQTICIENTSITGSGKTLANFAAAILDRTPTCGVYPTNELMVDQAVSLHQYLARQIGFLDSQGLDAILAEQSHMRTHAHALEWATGDNLPLAFLTNPDVLYLAMYSLYGRMLSTFAENFGARVFRNMLSNCPIIAFDEFHLYNAKQIANTAFIMGVMKELAPSRPHIFVFSSATPQPQFKQYVQRLGIARAYVTDTPATGEKTRVVCEQLFVHFLSADLLRWQGGETIRTQLDEILRWANSQQSQSQPCRGVFIVDSVYEAKCLAADLRDRGYPLEDVGEVHGYMSAEDRSRALLCRFSVGTTTIDVGVDLTGEKGKEFLVCEARSAAQAIQRLGRLGRQGRESEAIPVPNNAWIVVPEYVFAYIEQNRSNEASLTRGQFNGLLETAYLAHASFFAYTEKYAPLEAVAASERIQRHTFEDTLEAEKEKLTRLVPTLYHPSGLTSQQEMAQWYTRQRRIQLAKWRQYGTKIAGARGQNQFFLSDLESFRGGMESDFTVAIYDDLDERQGFQAVKTYALPFVLRRTRFTELSAERFYQLVQKKHPQQADAWLTPIKAQHKRLLGYVHVQELITGKAHEVSFEIAASHIESAFHQVLRLQGFTIADEMLQLHAGPTTILENLKKRQLNCWVSERSGYALSESHRLPPLFALYPLRARLANGKAHTWSIAFGLDAFFLESIVRPPRRLTQRTNDSAIFL